MTFDSIQRNDDTHKKNGESSFQFYNRSSRPEIGRVRRLIEDFISRYPDDEVEELIARIRSGDDTNFKSATFELFLHEGLLRKGFKLSAHPDLPNGSGKKPDFLVKCPDGCEFYLEAVLATENYEADQGGEARKGIVLDSLSANPHQNFMVEIEDESYPKSQPSSKKLIRDIHRWLDSLDPDSVQQQINYQGFDSIIPFEWSHENWEMKFRPIPLKSEKRGKSTNLIGIGGMAVGWVDTWSPIRDAIKYKGSKYGILEKPLLVAVNFNSFDLDKIDEMQALYGQEQFFFEVGKPDKEPRMERAPNGVWHNKRGPQYTRVSGAWIFNDLHPSSIAVRKQTIYFNPWATYPLPDSLKYFPYAIPENNKMCWFDGVSFAELYGLNEGWPE